MIGTCAVLFGGSVIGESPVFVDETPITHTVEQAKEESPAVEEKENQAVTEHKDAASVDQSQAAPIEAKQTRGERRGTCSSKRGESISKT